MNERLRSVLAHAEQLLEDATHRVRLARDAVAASQTSGPPHVRDLIQQRRLRDGFFAPGLFSDPAWDILLDLTAARLDGDSVSMTSACIAAAVPTTTALRWVGVLVAAGLVERYPDRRDKRRVNVRLTDSGWEAMAAYLERIGVPTAVEERRGTTNGSGAAAER